MKARKSLREVVEEVDQDMVMKWKRQNKLLRHRINSLEARIEEYHTFEYALLLELASIANAGKIEPENAWFLRRLLDWEQIPSFAGTKEKLLDLLDKAVEEEQV